MGMNWKDKLAIARIIARTKFPYFSAAITGLVPKAAPGLGTFACTKKGVLLVDPACVEKWEPDTIATAYIHELGHLLRKHHDRAEAIAADPAEWNKAGDAEINDDLIAAGMKFPIDPITPEYLGQKNGLTAEEYYRSTRDGKKGSKAGKPGKPGEKSGKGGKGGKGKGTQDGSADADGDDGGEGKTPSHCDKNGPGSGADGKDGSEHPSPCCGSAAGHAHPKEAEFEGTSGRTEREINAIRRQVAEAVRQEASKGRGTVPGGWSRWADDELKPAKVPWRTKLRHAVRASLGHKAGMVDQTFRRLSRRQAGVGYGAGRPILPGFHAPIPNVAVIVDTSGSMGQDELLAAVSETAGVIKAVGAEVRFLANDAAVHEMRRVKTWREAAELLKGGGGTDFGPPLRALAEERVKPDVVIFVTDGDGPAPSEPPPFRVIWVLVGRHARHPCKWGEHIELDMEDET